MDRSLFMAQTVRIMADQGKSGQEILRWLAAQNVTGAEARQLCAEVIRERRDATRAEQDRLMLVRINQGCVYLSSLADGFRISGDEFVSMADGARMRDLRDRGLIGLTYQTRGELYPADGWPQPYVLTDAGRKQIDD
jgi:hypothetical protein